MPPQKVPVAHAGAIAVLSAVSRPQKINTIQLHNRLLALMLHTTRYAFKGETRLAHDAGVSKSAVCRLLNGRSSPSFALVAALTRALEKQLGHSLDLRDVISLDGTYPTASVCEVCGCKGCLPDAVYTPDNNIRAEYRHLKPGAWEVIPPAIAPNGLLQIVEIGVHDDEEVHTVQEEHA